MAKQDIHDGIRKRAQTDIQIAQELTEIVEFLIGNGYVPGNSAIKTPDLESRCPAASYYRITRLVDEMGMVLKFSQGPSTYLIHTRKDEIVNGQGVSAMVNEELRRIQQHAQQNPTVRNVVAKARNCPANQAFQNYLTGSFAERRDRLEKIVNEIKNDPRVSQGNYGKIIFRTPANLYRASTLAIQLYNK